MLGQTQALFLVCPALVLCALHALPHYLPALSGALPTQRPSQLHLQSSMHHRPQPRPVTKARVKLPITRLRILMLHTCCCSQSSCVPFRNRFSLTTAVLSCLQATWSLGKSAHLPPGGVKARFISRSAELPVDDVQASNMLLLHYG